MDLICFQTNHNKAIIGEFVSVECVYGPEKLSKTKRSDAKMVPRVRKRNGKRRIAKMKRMRFWPKIKAPIAESHVKMNQPCFLGGRGLVKNGRKETY